MRNIVQGKNLGVSFTVNVHIFSLAGNFSCTFFFFQNRPDASAGNVAFTYSYIKSYLVVTL